MLPSRHLLLLLGFDSTSNTMPSFSWNIYPKVTVDNFGLPEGILPPVLCLSLPIFIAHVLSRRHIKTTPNLKTRPSCSVIFEKSQFFC
jgi:hypothetical protein